VRCYISYRKQDGSVVEERVQSQVTTSGTEMSYLLLAEDYKFPVATFGLNDTENPRVNVTVECRVSPNQVSKGTHTKTMGIDCILLVPHGSLELVDALPEDNTINSRFWGKPGVVMYPHGRDHLNVYYMPR
jgi:hypothetical protein